MSRPLKILATLVLLNLSSQTQATTPNYESTTGRLNLPEVLINGHTYSDVVLLLGSDGRYQVLSLTSPILLTDADNKRTIELSQGQFLEIKLASNPTTGYSWSFDDASVNFIERQGDSSFVLDKSCGDMMAGCGGNELWKFKAIKQGNEMLQLEYKRPWETIAPAQVFQLSIIVR